MQRLIALGDQTWMVAGGTESQFAGYRWPDFARLARCRPASTIPRKKHRAPTTGIATVS